MREPSKILLKAVPALLLVVAAAAPVSAAEKPPFPSTSFTPVVFYYPMSAGGPDGGCATLASKGPRWLDWWRDWWSSAWQHREAREEVSDRPTAAPFYLRSPMLSGFFGRGGAAHCAGGDDTVVRGDEAEEPCAELVLVPDAQSSTRLHVPLPQFDARNARALASAINERLARGETVVLTLKEGKKYPVAPFLTREVAARTCSMRSS